MQGKRFGKAHIIVTLYELQLCVPGELFFLKKTYKVLLRWHEHYLVNIAGGNTILTVKNLNNHRAKI